MTKKNIYVLVIVGTIVSSQSAQSEIHISDYSVGYSNATGTIAFDDWGFVGPDGVGANDYQVGSGYDASQLGQVQRVQTVAPDWYTPDGSSDYVMPESSKTIDNIRDPAYPWTYRNASNDGQVNFYSWIYTTPSSTFNNMQIDKSGNYFVEKEDMAFGFYDRFEYNDVTNDSLIDTTGMTDAEIANAKHDETLMTDLAFQPYAVSDATGWCGSVMASNPNSLEAMAGQVKFDFAFDQCGFGTVCGEASNTQLVPDFVMRSYGSYEVNVVKGSTNQSFTSSAVINNTNPETGLVDADSYNNVSFHGAGVVPDGSWVTKDSYELDAEGNVLYDGAGYPIKKENADGTWAVTIVEEGTPGAQWHINAFAGYAFLLRADGIRILEKMDMSYYDDTSMVPATSFDAEGNMLNVEGQVIADISAVPVPAAVWLFGTGLVALIGVARRKVS